MYFITICTQNKKCFFGKIVEGKMKLNIAGKIVEEQWEKLENKFNITLHEYIIMPNHIHGIIEINNVGMPLVGILGNNVNNMAPTRDATTISDIIGAFKSIATNEYIKNVKIGKIPPFNKKIW